MEYEEAKARLKGMQDTATRYGIEMRERKAYLTDVLHMKADLDVKYQLLKIMSDSIGREIAAYKEYVQTFPEASEDASVAPSRRMWRGLSVPEKCVIDLIRMEIGEDRFGQLCQQGYEIAKRRNELQKQRKVADQGHEESPRDKELRGYSYMMQSNSNRNLYND